MEDENRIVRFVSKHPFYIGIGAILGLVVIYFVNFRKLDLSNDVAPWGQFGDYLGGLLNPIFGLLSVVIISATLQAQLKANKKQEFATQFFSLLTLYDSVLNGIDQHHVINNHVRNGRDCFLIFFREIKEISKRHGLPFEAAYSAFLVHRGWEIEHYFRTVYHLFKHVRDGRIAGLVSESEKKKYYDLIKSQISQYELILLWLNTRSEHKGNWDALIADSFANPFEHLNKALLNNEHLIGVKSELKK